MKVKLSHRGENDKSYQGCLSRQDQQMVGRAIGKRPNNSIQVVYKYLSPSCGDFFMKKAQLLGVTLEELVRLEVI